MMVGKAWSGEEAWKTTITIEEQSFQGPVTEMNTFNFFFFFNENL